MGIWPRKADLQQALDKREFVLYYQPEVELVSRRIVGLDQTIALPGNGQDVALALAWPVQCFSDRRYVDLNVVFFNGTAAPDISHQLILADCLAIRLRQHAKDIKRSASEPHG